MDSVNCDVVIQCYACLFYYFNFVRNWNKKVQLRPPPSSEETEERNSAGERPKVSGLYIPPVDKASPKVSGLYTIFHSKARLT